MIMVFIPRVHDLMIDHRSQTEKPDQALVISTVPWIRFLNLTVLDGFLRNDQMAEH